MAHAHQAVKVAETVLEVADVAWTAIEHLHRHRHHEEHDHNQEPSCCLSPEELESLKSENKRLRKLLEENLKLLQNLSESPCAPDDCPSDLHGRLLHAVDSTKFCNQLQNLHNASAHETENAFPFKEPTDADIESAEILVNVDQDNPSWWVWINDDMVPGAIEECSGIDNDNYVLICEEHVVDGVANFIARCVLSNPKAQKLSPVELQKAVANSLEGMNKFEKMLNIWHAGKLFYALSTWGLAFAGLYRSRTVLKLVAKGVRTTGGVVLKAI